jgi:hypothetical protein
LIGHKRHVAASVAPVLVEYVPAPQSVHVALPVLVLYFPATQAAHEPPSGPVNPALQVQAARVVLGLGELELLGHATQVASTVACELDEYFPAPQSVHAALPLVVLYFPATQAVHGPPFGPVNPALQAVATQAVPPLGEVEPAGHVRHALAPAAGAYAPTTQFIQTVALLPPVTSEYVPDEHAKQPTASTTSE